MKAHKFIGTLKLLTSKDYSQTASTVSPLRKLHAFLQMHTSLTFTLSSDSCPKILVGNYTLLQNKGEIHQP